MKAIELKAAGVPRTAGFIDRVINHRGAIATAAAVAGAVIAVAGTAAPGDALTFAGAFLALGAAHTLNRKGGAL